MSTSIPQSTSISSQGLYSLSKEQKRLATTRTPRGLRRIKGRAGSGKSLVLAARAAQLATEKKRCPGGDVQHYLAELLERFSNRPLEIFGGRKKIEGIKIEGIKFGGGKFGRPTSGCGDFD